MAKNGRQGGSSLQDQLRKVGLVTEKQLRKAKKGLHRKDMRIRHGEIDESRLAVETARAEKFAGDLTRNKERDHRMEAKSVLAQIKQLIGMNSKRQPGDIPYNFSKQNKIKKIYISEENKLELNKGYLAIVKTANGYDLVPEKVALKIMARSDDVVLYLYDRDQDAEDEDDPYKDFKIPDDLEW